MAASLRRWGLAGLVAATGVVLLLFGIAAALVDAQLRSDAATAAVTLTSEDRERLEEVGLAASVETDAGYIRRMLIMRSLSTGTAVPERAYEIQDQGDGNVSMSWGGGERFQPMFQWGGWQLMPIGVLTFAGLALMIGSLFLAAERWRDRHPLD
ncbi:MAG: hypothetical protein ABWX56_02010 [Mycetocola sp.]